MSCIASLLLIFVIVCSICCDAIPKYIIRLPNGYKVPGSQALGHVNANGTGALNAFGREFIASAHQWSTDLCHSDSDGDGQTNGQELGDPCCEWVPGDIPRFTDGVSHPGDALDTANASMWLDIVCPNITKLSISERSGVWQLIPSVLMILWGLVISNVVMG